jgi:NADH:ubiquinone oxidoreductase subunit 6 (subunit J)
MYLTTNYLSVNTETLKRSWCPVEPLSILRLILVLLSLAFFGILLVVFIAGVFTSSWSQCVIPVAASLLAAALLCAESPVHALLCLIGAFLSAVCIFIAVGAEFLGFVFLIVYVGAIAVLFLFVIMLLSIPAPAEVKLQAIKWGFAQQLLFGVLFFVFIRVHIKFLSYTLAPNQYATLLTYTQYYINICMLDVNSFT